MLLSNFCFTFVILRHFIIWYVVKCMGSLLEVVHWPIAATVNFIWFSCAESKNLTNHIMYAQSLVCGCILLIYIFFFLFFSWFCKQKQKHKNSIPSAKPKKVNSSILVIKSHKMIERKKSWSQTKPEGKTSTIWEKQRSTSNSKIQQKQTKMQHI